MGVAGVMWSSGVDGVVVRRGVVWCGVMWCSVVWCGRTWRGLAWSGVEWLRKWVREWLHVRVLHLFSRLACTGRTHRRTADPDTAVVAPAARLAAALDGSDRVEATAEARAAEAGAALASQPVLAVQ